jgi:hypothetical protein
MWIIIFVYFGIHINQQSLVFLDKFILSRKLFKFELPCYIIFSLILHILFNNFFSEGYEIWNSKDVSGNKKDTKNWNWTPKYGDCFSGYMMTVQETYMYTHKYIHIDATFTYSLFTLSEW